MVFAMTAEDARAQFTVQWLDIGSMRNLYVESGALHEGAMGNRGVAWPAIQRHSGHSRSEYFWIGHKDWTSPSGQQFPDFSSRLGPRTPGAEFVTPIHNRLVSKWEDTEVFVDGQPSFDVGCFQLNYKWHGEHFASIDQMFEPGPSGERTQPK